MSWLWSSIGHGSSSSRNRFALADSCSVMNAYSIPITRTCLENLQFLPCKQAVLTLHGGNNCTRKIALSKTHSLWTTVDLYRKRKSNVFKPQSAEGTERSVTGDHSSDFEKKVGKPTNKWASNESSGESQKKMRKTQENVDKRLPDDSQLRVSEFEEMDSDGNSDVNYSSYEDSSVFEKRSQECERIRCAASGDEGTGDYGSEPLLDKNEKVEYVTRIMVPRQRYIRIPKAELVNALSLFSNQRGTTLSSVSAFLELVLHTKHKFMLEELRADYKPTHSTSDGGSPEWLKDNSSKAASAAKKTRSSRTPSGERSLVSTREEEQLPHCDSPEDTDLVNDSTKTDNSLTQDKLPRWKSWGMNFLSVFKQGKGTQFESDNVGDFQTETRYNEEARTASAKRFQKNFLKMLRSAQFEGLSAHDLELTAALNSDYLLTIPIAVDWKRASKSNTIIYRRGYAKEQQKGLLLGAKFDYLQSAWLRGTLNGLTGPLINTGRWFMQKWKSLRNDPEGRVLAETVERWVEEPLQSDGERSPQDKSERQAQEEYVPTKESEMDLPIWKAAKQAVPRYEAVLSSAGSRGLLIRRILVSMGLLPSDSIPTTLSDNQDSSAVEPHLRPNFLSRVSMKDIWLSASKAAVGENSWKRFRAAFSVFFTQVTLQEPAFQELVLLYSDDGQEQSEASNLQLKMYRSIPLPDLKIIFPSKRLSFRLIDTVRLDLTTFVGLTAFLCNYHFEGFLSSPSAFTLDVIAASALLVFVTRAALGYKQTWDRYQLLVNKTLYEKTLANGFGVVHFLIDAAEEQQFKEAIVAFSILSQQGKGEEMSKEQLANACERFLYYRCKEQTEMPVDNALKNLLDLGLVYISKNISSPLQRDSEVRYRALTYDEGLEALKQYWESLPSNVVL